ncbi:hypothetical protein C5B42_00565 [Candidatus Cerribacteria bacterium 'Amazon FNV 2010 28 9']|uniref:Uncharacterized protein n=1 Tax=Candidatus Cerribacteria bacterium 'Amazon FNV 2010 28 9' TaxID=2081795 RepID=A0A317JSQ7_9BACT|nr:MAG: hypothetical protein C5B42_00565 [Candidatus Cerribacteria bacterium 'Amazon FNV 2010 28 9']
MYKLKQDKYRKVRGGCSRFLVIHCSSCSTILMIYQKDGPGILKRAYFDRIFSPSLLVESLKKGALSQIDKLRCSQCNTLIGSPYLYEKENRPAFLLIPGSFSKKICKSTNLPTLN